MGKLIDHPLFIGGYWKSEALLLLLFSISLVGVVSNVFASQLKQRANHGDK